MITIWSNATEPGSIYTDRLENVIPMRTNY